MSRTSFNRNTTLAGIAVLALAASPMPGAVSPVEAAAAPAWSTGTCPGPTAATKQLARIDKTGVRDFQCVGVFMLGGAIKAIRVETHSFTPDGGQPEQEQVRTEDFSRAVIESSRGAVLDGVPGHDAIVLRGHFATPAGQADLVTSFLYNGFTGEYRNCRIMLDRASGGGWRLVDRFDQTVTHILVKTRLLPLLGAFGIADLEGACS